MMSKDEFAAGLAGAALIVCVLFLSLAVGGCIESRFDNSMLNRQKHVDAEAVDVINQVREGLIEFPTTDESIVSIVPHKVNQDIKGRDYIYLGQLKDNVYTIWVIGAGRDETPLTDDDDRATETYTKRNKNES